MLTPFIPKTPNPNGQQTINPAQLVIKPFFISPIAAIIASLILLGIFLYFGMPVVSFRFTGWIFRLLVIVMPLFFVKKLRKPIIYVLSLLFFFFFILNFTSTPLFRANAFRNLLGNIESTNFTELITPVALDQIPIVDREFAAALGEKKLGDDFALGSRVSLGKPTRQMVNGKLFWVIPLLHSGFFKWLGNMNEGTPGYIMVSATNPQDVRFIRELNGKPIKIVYQPGAFFNQNLHRKVYFNGVMSKGITDYTFEIDDSGMPFWTTSVYTHKIGVAGPETVGTAIVNAQTGETEYYPLIKTEKGWSDEKLPIWVDRIHPSDFVINQLNWWGQYVHGFFNTIFGKRDMLMTTEGYNVIYGGNNRSFFYTGMTSVGADEGTVGFVMTDSRTKQTHLYKLSGATEFASMRSAEGKVQNYKYQATFPIIVNIGGLPTYFLTLKDNSGLVKMFAFVSIKDFSIVGVGESIKNARDNYLMTLSTSRIGILPEGSSEKIMLTGSVNRIGGNIKDGSTYYYFNLAEKPDLLFIATLNISSVLPLTQKGDMIKLSYLQTTEKEINISEFNNLSINPESK